MLKATVFRLVFNVKVRLNQGSYLIQVTPITLCHYLG